MPPLMSGWGCSPYTAKLPQAQAQPPFQTPFSDQGLLHHVPKDIFGANVQWRRPMSIGMTKHGLSQTAPQLEVDLQSPIETDGQKKLQVPLRP
eukprot:65029-Amphidinium_carterae.1